MCVLCRVNIGSVIGYMVCIIVSDLYSKELKVNFRVLLDLLMFIGLIALWYQNHQTRLELSAINSLMESSSEMADQTIQSIANSRILHDLQNEGMSQHFENSKALQPVASKVGALRVTNKLSKAFGEGRKIVVKPSVDQDYYIAEIAEKPFQVTADEQFIVIEGIKVPIDEHEYAKFQSTPDFRLLKSKADNADGITSNSVSVPGQSLEEETKDEINPPFYGPMLPGTSAALNNLSQRAEILDRTKEHVITYPAIDENQELYVAFDISCPHCRKFYSSIPSFQEAGITIHLMLIDKTRMYSSSRAKEMERVYCQANPTERISKLLKGESFSDECPNGQQFLESMTNAALLAGAIGTPALFTKEGVLLARYDEKAGEYVQSYYLNNIKQLLSML